MAQTCTGSLGENIFTTGDFGSGVANFLATDPQIAPGYSYTTSPPPQDGLYSITNSTALWSDLFPTWLEIDDNSDDPNGYMMVVNASIEPGLFYDQTVDGLCENTLYFFSVDIINMIRVGVPDHIQPNVSFLIDNVVSFSSGAIPQDAAWHNYGFTFTTNPGQTSVQLSLQNNAPGGIGNDLALDNISFRPCGPEAFILPETIANICEDGTPIDLEATVLGDQYLTPQYQWQISLDEGSTWNNIDGAQALTHRHDLLSSGYYFYRFLLANDPNNLTNDRCRVISNEKIVFVQPKFYEVIDTICMGLTRESGGNTYDRTGIFIDSLTSSIGCDSIITLDLTVLPDPNLMVELSVDDLKCHDQPEGTISVHQVLNGQAPYEVIIAGNSFQLREVADQLSAGAYPVSVVDKYGCRFFDTVSISAPEPFRIDIGPDTVLVFGDELRLSASSNDFLNSILWVGDQDIDCNPDCQNFPFFPVRSQTLIGQAVSESGCSAIDSLRVMVLNERPIYFPNSFTPNNDGLNDYFNVYSRANIVEAFPTLSIYDRWGGLVWQGHNLIPNAEHSGWSGMTKTGLAQPGVYVYLAEIQFIDGEVRIISGSLQLMN